MQFRRPSVEAIAFLMTLMNIWVVRLEIIWILRKGNAIVNKLLHSREVPNIQGNICFSFRTWSKSFYWVFYFLPRLGEVNHVNSVKSCCIDLSAYDKLHTPCNGPKAFVSEYAMTGKDAGAGSLLAALAEAGFLIGLEKNSNVVEMASYAPLFVNANKKRWNPDAIVFISSQLYGTPSYWVQCFFSESSGATIFNATLQTNSSTSILASAISWKSSEDQKTYLRIKIVNFGSSIVNLRIHVDGLEPDSISLSGSTKTLLTSKNVMDENSFNEPKKVIPNPSLLE